MADRDHVLGAEKPELTLIEYGDFGCPYCFAAKRPIESLLERYDTMRLVWRQFPDPELHPGADLAAELSELAADAGRFWEATIGPCGIESRRTSRPGRSPESAGRRPSS